MPLLFFVKQCNKLYESRTCRSLLKLTAYSKPSSSADTFALGEGRRIVAPTVIAAGQSTRERVLGQNIHDRFPFLVTTKEDVLIRAALGGQSNCAPIQPNLVAETGKDSYYEARYAPLTDVSGAVVGVIGVVRDETVQKALEAELQHHAFHDALTGLPNRVLFLPIALNTRSRLVRTTGNLRQFSSSILIGSNSSMTGSVTPPATNSGWRSRNGFLTTFALPTPWHDSVATNS